LLIEAAERLFGERGVDAVSINEIRQAAGQRHSSVITYYFGTKEGLLRAILAHRLQKINAERAVLLAEIDGRNGPDNARDLIRALLAPLISSVNRDESYVAFLLRMLLHPETTQLFESTEFTEASREVVARLTATLRDLPPEVARERMQLLYDSVLHTLSRLSNEKAPLTEDRLSHFVDAWAAMLTAPLSAARSSRAVATSNTPANGRRRRG